MVSDVDCTAPQTSMITGTGTGGGGDGGGGAGGGVLEHDTMSIVAGVETT